MNVSVSDLWVLYTCKDPHFISIVQNARDYTHGVIKEARNG